MQTRFSVMTGSIYSGNNSATPPAQLPQGLGIGSGPPPPARGAGLVRERTRRAMSMGENVPALEFKSRSA